MATLQKIACKNSKYSAINYRKKQEDFLWKYAETLFSERRYIAINVEINLFWGCYKNKLQVWS